MMRIGVSVLLLEGEVDKMGLGIDRDGVRMRHLDRALEDQNVSLILSASVSAQWLDFREPAIPRTRDGKPNLAAPAPRTPEGKPDLGGLWEPEANPYRFDVIQDVKDEGVFRPAAEALFLKRAADLRRDNPVTHYLSTRLAARCPTVVDTAAD